MDMTTKCATDGFSPFVMSVRFGNEKRDPVNTGSRYQNLAVKEGFEPSIRCRIHTFQACSFSHSDTSPYVGHCVSTGRYYKELQRPGQCFIAHYHPFAWFLALKDRTV